MLLNFHLFPARPTQQQHNVTNESNVMPPVKMNKSTLTTMATTTTTFYIDLDDGELVSNTNVNARYLSKKKKKDNKNKKPTIEHKSKPNKDKERKTHSNANRTDDIVQPPIIEKRVIPIQLQEKIDSIKNVAIRNALIIVLSDKRLDYIKNTGQGFLYVDDFNNVITLKGITKILRELFWPDFDFSKIKKNKKKNDAPSTSEHDPLAIVGGKVEKSKKKNKLSFLTRKDDFIKIYNIQNASAAKQINSTRLKNKVFLGRGQVRSKLMGMEKGQRWHMQIDEIITFGMKHYEETKGPIEPAVRAFFETMETDWNWVPIMGELPVYHLKSKKVTAVDLLVYDKILDRIVLVEVKTGYDDCFEKGEKQMKKRMGMNNSPLSQAKVQLVATAAMFLDMFPVDPIACYIVWINTETKIERYWIEPATYQVVEKKLRKHFFVLNPKIPEDPNLKQKN